MVLTQGYYDWPLQQFITAMQAAGSLMSIVEAHDEEAAVTTTTQTTVLDNSSAGPGVIMWMTWKPAGNKGGKVWLDIDGAEVITNESVHPVGNNYVIGKVWEGTDEHACYNFDIAFFSEGFSIDAKLDSLYLASGNAVQCKWYELSWS
jgi:hypothetical protein